MFYEVTVNTELLDSEPWLMVEILGQAPTGFWSWHFHQVINIQPCFMCVKDILFNIMVESLA